MGRKYLHGVDYSTHAISIGWAGDSRGVMTAKWEKGLKGGELLARVYSEAAQLSIAVAFIAPPMFVLVEQPSGYSRNLSLTYTCGVVQVAIYNALCRVYPHPVDVATVPSGKWKKEILGHGHADKEMSLAWAREHGYEGNDDNESDAMAIAEYLAQGLVV